MDLNFSPDEVFKIAEQLERNGVKFYSKAVEVSKGNDKAKEQFQKLADMEKEHEKVFSKMRKNLSDGSGNAVYDPDGHVALYLQSWADRQVFDEKGELSEVIIDNKSVEDILNIAIGLERDSILFYLGMGQMTSVEDSKTELENIINEEMKHIAYLSKELNAIRS